MVLSARTTHSSPFLGKAHFSQRFPKGFMLTLFSLQHDITIWTRCTLTYKALDEPTMYLKYLIKTTLPWESMPIRCQGHGDGVREGQTNSHLLFIHPRPETAGRQPSRGRHLSLRRQGGDRPPVQGNLTSPETQPQPFTHLAQLRSGLSHGGQPTIPCPPGAELEVGPSLQAVMPPRRAEGQGLEQTCSQSSEALQEGREGFPPILVTALPSSTANNNGSSGLADLGLHSNSQAGIREGAM